MPFRPVNDRHAIQEVVFVLTFSRPFSGQEMDRFVNAHERWRGELPAPKRDQVVSLMVGSGPFPPMEPPVAGALFERYKADGSLAWRLRAHENWLAVNCLVYTGWADVWGNARWMLQQGSEAISSEDNPVGGLALQYINVFVWEGDPAQYDLKELLRVDSEFIPACLWGKGPLWHLHQGWFREDELPVGGRRLLERMHIDAQHREDKHLVKLDSTLRVDLAEGLRSPELFEGEAPRIEQIFEPLHSQSKRVLAGYLSTQMIDRIGLNA